MIELITNQEFRSKLVLDGLEIEGEQFKISPNAVVRIRVKSDDGLTDYTGWIALSHNENKDDDWGLSTLDVIIPYTETGLVSASKGYAKLDVNIQAAYVDRDGADTSSTYDKTWTHPLCVREGLTSESVAIPNPVDPPVAGELTGIQIISKIDTEIGDDWRTNSVDLGTFN